MNTTDKYCLKPWLGIIVAALLSLSLVSCRNEKHEMEKPTITVSILPQKYFLEKLSGDQFNIRVMIPPGQSPATYDPTPDQMVTMAGSTIYFLIGHIEFEKAWIRKLIPEYPRIRFIDTSEGIETEYLDHAGENHSHHDFDPHIWMSVMRVRKIASTMASALKEVYPEEKNTYERNLQKFNRELDALDTFIKNELKDCAGEQFIIYHPALSYLAKDYGLEQVPIEQEGKEPTAHYMRTLIDRAVADSITAILIQKQFNQQEARTIEKEIGGRLIVIDPLEENWMEEMKRIAEQLKNALTK
jgi:zinc transport system substrate-binding protein